MSAASRLQEQNAASVFTVSSSVFVHHTPEMQRPGVFDAAGQTQCGPLSSAEDLCEDKMESDL